MYIRSVDVASSSYSAKRIGRAYLIGRLVRRRLGFIGSCRRLIRGRGGGGGGRGGPRSALAVLNLANKPAL